MLPLPFDPFGTLANEAVKLIAQGWTAIMLALWNCGLWLLRLVMTFMDAFLTPDLSETGPAAALYRTTFWLGGAVTVVLCLVQLGVAALRRDGKSLAQLLIGVAQFAVVWVAIVTYAVVLVAAAGGLTTSLMEALLNVTTWSTWQPWTPFDVKDITDAVLATLLGVMGVFLLLAAIGHFFIMIVRGAALLILVATSPIAAAGLVGDLGRGWFWKTFRWLHAAAFTPPLVVLVMGIGVQLASGVAVGGSSSVETSVGTAFPAVMLICASVVSPLALFKMLAFVDPGTATGAQLRAGWAAAGGLQGVLTGGGGGDTGSSAASASGPDGRSGGEASAEAAQSSRVAGAVAGGAGRLGPVGGLLAGGIGAVMGTGSAAVGIGADVTNQMGAGHNSYYPDYTAGGHGNAARPTGRGGGQAGAGNPPDPGGAGGGGDPADCPDDGDAPTAPTAPAPPVAPVSPWSPMSPGMPARPPAGSAAGSTGSAAGTGGSAGSSAAGGAVTAGEVAEVAEVAVLL